VRGYAIALLGALLAAPVRTAAQQPQTIRINYVNADLSDVIRSLAAVMRTTSRTCGKTPTRVPIGATVRC